MEAEVSKKVCGVVNELKSIMSHVPFQTTSNNDFHEAIYQLGLIDSNMDLESLKIKIDIAVNKLQSSIQLCEVPREYVENVRAQIAVLGSCKGIGLV